MRLHSYRTPQPSCSDFDDRPTDSCGAAPIGLSDTRGNMIADGYSTHFLQVLRRRVARSAIEPTKIRAPLDRKQLREQTVAKLMDGFLAQLGSHRGTGLDVQDAS